MLDYCLLLGYEIDLSKFGLGTITQPKLKDFIEKGITFDEFYRPYILTYLILKNSNDPKTVLEMKEKLGSLSFILVNITNSKDKINYLNDFKKSLSIIYDTENVVLDKSLNYIIDDEIVISNDNFDALSNTILDMIKIDRKSLSVDVELTGIAKKRADKIKAYEEEVRKKKLAHGIDDSLTLIDMCNIIVHSGIFTYNDLRDMTVFQIKNTYEVCMTKESYETSLMYKASPKFDTSKDDKKMKHWTDKAKIRTLNTF